MSPSESAAGRRLRDRLGAAPLVFDGAMATLLRAAGWPTDRPVELASVEAPELVRKIHEAYRAAGAEVLTANTFGAHALGADRLMLADQIEELCQAALTLAREAAGPDGWAAASVGPPGEPIYPLGDQSYRAAVAAYRRQLAACRAAGADLYVLESFTDLLELQAALTAAREADVGPVVASMALRPERLAAGLVSAEAAVEVAQALGADLVGLNCMPPADTARALERLLPRARVPVVAQPAGGGAEQVAAWAEPLAALGVQGLGGCCGTTPADVESLARALRRVS